MKIPFLSNSLPQEFWVSTSRYSINTIIGAHNTANITLFNTHLERS